MATVDSEVPGSTSAKILGILQILYGIMVFVILILGGHLRPGHLLVVAVGLIALLSGIGLYKLNYYAWFFSIALAAIILLSGFVTVIMNGINGNLQGGSVTASKMVVPLIAFWLLYRARKACKRKTLPAVTAS